MSFSKEWDERYREGSHMSRWPWSDLVSFTYRYARPTGPDFRVLELGCGAGANIPFYQALGVRYHAVEGSPSIVSQLCERFPEYRETIVAGDFTGRIPFEPGFDLVVDRAALTHNGTDAIRSCIKGMLGGILKPGGVFLGIDWFATTHSEYPKGEAAEDRYTRQGFVGGQFAGVGRVHFSDRPHLEELFSGFEILALEEKQSRFHIPADGFNLATWNLAARRK
jgi:SAM-dependent methyltransferase